MEKSTVDTLHNYIIYLFISYSRKRGGDRTGRWQTREAKATSDAFHTSPAQRIGKVFFQNSLPGHLPKRGNSCENRPHGKSRSGRCGQNVQIAVGTKRLIQREMKPIAWLCIHCRDEITLRKYFDIVHIKIVVIWRWV